MANNSSLSKRAALRLQQEQAERTKRNKRIAFAGVGLVAVVVIVVLGIVLFQALAATGRVRETTENQLTPPNATQKSGILLDGIQPTADKPHLVIYQDYQCPWCALYEQSFGGPLEELVESGKITAEFRTAFFLDGQVEYGPSRRAALAAAAADEVGHYAAYHRVIYKNHAESSTAYSDRELRETFAKEAGIEGDDLTRFQELYDTKAFNDFTAAAGQQFTDSGLTGTPAYLVSGQQLNLIGQDQQPVIPTTSDALLQLITQAWESNGKKNND